jgi:hypothetical protein
MMDIQVMLHFRVWNQVWDGAIVPVRSLVAVTFCIGIHICLACLAKFRFLDCLLYCFSSVRLFDKAKRLIKVYSDCQNYCWSNPQQHLANFYNNPCNVNSIEWVFGHSDRLGSYSNTNFIAHFETLIYKWQIYLRLYLFRC